MQVPPSIVLRGIQMNPEIDGLIGKGLDGLEEVCDYIVSARVALEQEQGRRQRGNPYQMRIDVRIPGAEVVVKRSSKALTKPQDALTGLQAKAAMEGEPEPEINRSIRRVRLPRQKSREEPLESLIRRSFDAAQRELRKVVDRQRGEVKSPAQPASAIIELIVRERDYGFLRTLDGEQVYFHKNSVLHGHWDRLSVGTAVRYEAEMGEKGLQASTVEPVEKPGAEEAHDSLHRLPRVAPEKVSGKRQ